MCVLFFILDERQKAVLEHKNSKVYPYQCLPLCQPFCSQQNSCILTINPHCSLETGRLYCTHVIQGGTATQVSLSTLPTC